MNTMNTENTTAAPDVPLPPLPEPSTIKTLKLSCGTHQRPLFDSLQVHQYAVRYGDAVRAALAAQQPAADEQDHFGYVDSKGRFYQPDLPGGLAQHMTAVYVRPAASGVLSEADRAEALRLARTFDARTELAHDIIDAATLLGRIAAAPAVPAASELERLRAVAEALRTAGIQALEALSVSTVSPRGEALRQAAREALRPAIDAATGAAWLSGQPAASGEQAAQDTARLEWLLHRLSGAELRRIGVVTSSGGLRWGREAIDAAMQVQGGPAGTTGGAHHG